MVLYVVHRQVWGKKRGFFDRWTVIIDRKDRKVLKKDVYAVRLGDDECAIKRIHILDDAILLLSDNPEFPPMLAPTIDLDELIIGRVIYSWQSLLNRNSERIPRGLPRGASI